MSTWAWVGVGLAIFFVLSTLVTLAVATILGRVGREVGELLDSAAWSSAPLARGHAEDERFLAATCRVGGSRTPSRSRVGAHSDATRWPSPPESVAPSPSRRRSSMRRNSAGSTPGGPIPHGSGEGAAKAGRAQGQRAFAASTPALARAFLVGALPQERLLAGAPVVVLHAASSTDRGGATGAPCECARPSRWPCDSVP